jgi:hypothetical protein
VSQALAQCARLAYSTHPKSSIIASKRTLAKALPASAGTILYHSNHLIIYYADADDLD